MSDINVVNQLINLQLFIVAADTIHPDPDAPPEAQGALLPFEEDVGHGRLMATLHL